MVPVDVPAHGQQDTKHRVFYFGPSSSFLFSFFGAIKAAVLPLMRLGALVAAAALMQVATSSDGRSVRAHGTLQPAPVIESRDGRLVATLRVEVARRTVAHGVSFVTRTYNGSVPGPTFVVRPGDNVSITLINGLEINGPFPGSDAPAGTARGANTTNLHIHGIFDSPQHDNTFVAVDPGARRTWHYSVDPRYSSSLLWYHPHFDGSSAMQLAGGMLGAFLVAHPAHEALFAGWDTHLLLLQKLDLNRTDKDSIFHEAREAPTNLPPQLNNPAGFSGTMLLSNEQLAPRVSLRAGTPARLRLVNAIADSEGLLCLALQAGNLPPYPPDTRPRPPSASAAPTSHPAPSPSRPPSRRGAGRARAGEAAEGEGAAGCRMEVLALDGIFLDAPRTEVGGECVPAR